MGTTANLAIPYPEGGNAPNVPLYIKNLADFIDALLFDGSRQRGRVASFSTSTTSATWSTSTKVATNVQVAFDAISGGVYRAYSNFTLQGSLVGTTAVGMVWKAGATIAGTDTVIARTPYRVETNTALYGGLALLGEFTAGSSAQHAVGLVGWNPTGDTLVGNLFGDASYATNRIYVDRVG